MSAATNGKKGTQAPADEAADEPVPRALEHTFEEVEPDARASQQQGAGPSGQEDAAEARPAKAGGMMMTLFSPVYNLFAGGAALAGAGASDGKPPLAQTEAAEVDAEAQELMACTGEDAVDGREPEVAVEDDGEEGDEDFDPYLFISTLPPLSACVPEKRSPVLPRKKRGLPKNTLVLDLDETLVHSTLEDLATFDFTFPVHFNNQTHAVNVRKRPDLEGFMRHVGQKFEVIIFTASQRVYAERLLDIIDPEHAVIKHRIFRDSCVYVDGNYLKDLTVLGRDLARTIIVDNSPQAFGFQIDNGIPIESWFDDPTDRELTGLLPFLDRLAAADDVRPLIKAQFNLAEKVQRAAQRLD